MLLIPINKRSAAKSVNSKCNQGVTPIFRTPFIPEELNKIRTSILELKIYGCYGKLITKLDKNIMQQ